MNIIVSKIFKMSLTFYLFFNNFLECWKHENYITKHYWEFKIRHSQDKQSQI